MVTEAASKHDYRVLNHCCLNVAKAYIAAGHSAIPAIKATDGLRSFVKVRDTGLSHSHHATNPVVKAVMPGGEERDDKSGSPVATLIGDSEVSKKLKSKDFIRVNKALGLAASI